MFFVLEREEGRQSQRSINVTEKHPSATSYTCPDRDQTCNVLVFRTVLQPTEHPARAVPCISYIRSLPTPIRGFVSTGCVDKYLQNN